MGNIFLRLFVAVVFFNISWPSFGKSTPQYYISKSEPDKTLQTTEAIFAFHFSASDNNPVQQDIKLSYNGIYKTAKPDARGNIILNVKPGKYLFHLFYNKDFLEIKTDSINIKPTYRTEIKVYFKSSAYPITELKPVIYVYPEKKTTVNITLALKGRLDFTYPAYNKGWNFIADVDGTIHLNNKKYNYLFWEATSDILANKINWDEGFIVDQNNLVRFFEEKLSQMGLKSSEIQDYITYWCPRMLINKNNYIHFLFNEEYDEYAKLTVTPKPDKTFRVFMIWSKVDQQEKLALKEQTIQSFTRKGFFIVEWGGAQITKFEASESMSIQ